MNERKQILEMLAQGKITVVEAENLLKACEDSSEKSDEFSAQTTNKLPKFLHIQVDAKSSGEQEKVNIRVPIQLLKAGVKLAGFMPTAAKDSVNDALKDKGINIDLYALKPQELDAFLVQLCSTSVDVQTEKDNVRIYCE